MRKIGMLLLGLLLVAGAASMFGYRWVYQPGRLAAIARHESAPAPGASDSGRNVLTEQRGGRPPQSPSQGGGAEVLGWMSVEVVLNALNVLVGVIGIWVAWLGLRMQQTMAAMQADRRRDAG